MCERSLRIRQPAAHEEPGIERRRHVGVRESLNRAGSHDFSARSLQSRTRIGPQTVISDSSFLTTCPWRERQLVRGSKC